MTTNTRNNFILKTTTVGIEILTAKLSKFWVFYHNELDNTCPGDCDNDATTRNSYSMSDKSGNTYICGTMIDRIEIQTAYLGG